MVVLSLTETKGIAEDIANKFISIFNTEAFNKVIVTFMAKKYDEGTADIEKMLNFNFDPQQRHSQISMLSQYSFDLIKGMNVDLEKALRAEIQRGIINRDSKEQIKDRIKAIFYGDGPTRFRFEDRIEMIANTEGQRALNIGKLDVGLDSNRPLFKYLVNNEGPCKICDRAVHKYSRNNSIPIEDEFIVSVGGKTYITKDGIQHPNCRCEVEIVLYQQEKERRRED